MSQKKLVGKISWVFFIGWGGLSLLVASVLADESKAEQGIHIDIPVAIEKANVVFNLDHLGFDGDVPVGFKYMRLPAILFRELETKGRIIGIFHGDAAYMTLNDPAYNLFCRVNRGNSYKELVADLLKQGIRIEECAVSMKAHKWGNENLLPGVKVNTGAVGRLIQLGQQGYVQIQPKIRAEQGF